AKPVFRGFSREASRGRWLVLQVPRPPKRRDTGGLRCSGGRLPGLRGDTPRRFLQPKSKNSPRNNPPARHLLPSAPDSLRRKTIRDGRSRFPASNQGEPPAMVRAPPLLAGKRLPAAAFPGVATLREVVRPMSNKNFGEPWEGKIERIRENLREGRYV